MSYSLLAARPVAAPATRVAPVVTAKPVLAVADLSVRLTTPHGTITPVDRVGFTIAAGETLCLVGESGCGKSLTCLAIAGLLPPAGRIAAGAIRLGGCDLAGLSPREMARRRGVEIAMVYQDPHAALNPVMTIGRQIAESLTLHGHSRAAAMAEARRLLDRVGMPDAAARLRAYPHQLSGGMNQRAVIAMALACRPKLLIADEPTTALDVTVQAQILDLLRDAQRELGMALLLVTHDLGVVAEMADDVAVMYAGRIVEQGRVDRLFAAPAHPYSADLMACLPRIERDETLRPIPGTVPTLRDLPPGCAYAPRCRHVQARCEAERPCGRAVGAHQRVACHREVTA